MSPWAKFLSISHSVFLSLRMAPLGVPDGGHRVLALPASLFTY